MLNNKILVVLAFLAVLPAIGGVAKYVDAHFPVLTNIQFSKITPINEYQSIVSGTAEKVRECKFNYIDWRYYQPDINLDPRVESTLLRKLDPKNIGTIPFGPYRVNIPANEVKDHSLIYTNYDCWWSFWETKTLAKSPMEE